MSGFSYDPRGSSAGHPLDGIIGNSPAMQRVYELTRKVARSNASVLLLGETGTGKELIAGAIHRLSDRAQGPFVRVNCGALSESLLESELFGHVRGAFTSAVANRTGRFEAAHTGTIFLDEINSTSLLLQVKLLRVLQEKEFERVGDTNTITVDTRVIAASNRDLAAEVEAGRFREDLYWRLNVVPIHIPPLRERLEDIPQLVVHFLQHYSQANRRYVVHVQREALEAMMQYHWPGNVRELQNYVERAVVMAEGDELTIDLLPEVVRRGKSVEPVAGEPSTSLAAADWETLIQSIIRRGVEHADKDHRAAYDFVVSQIERELIAFIMSQCNNVQTKAAARLGINRNTLAKKLKDYGLDTDPS
ncbi:MAG: sigma-54-dependent Fis family transcriptional regulator [Pirellulaceae bacterium]|nr:MAG: sigma-54-dependent Fis family transcriptional regulator [Pirellulaceae bacterium]